MHVEITFLRFVLQNSFIQVKICFIRHIIVHPNICRSFDISRFFFFLNTATALKHRGSFFFGSVYNQESKSTALKLMLRRTIPFNTATPTRLRSVLMASATVQRFSSGSNLSTVLSESPVIQFVC